MLIKLTFFILVFILTWAAMPSQATIIRETPLPPVETRPEKTNSTHLHQVWNGNKFVWVTQ